MGNGMRDLDELVRRGCLLCEEVFVVGVGTGILEICFFERRVGVFLDEDFQDCMGIGIRVFLELVSFRGALPDEELLVRAGTGMRGVVLPFNV